MAKDRVRITDVSPRDGLQNEPGIIATADKVRLVRLVAAAGVDEVEVTSFVSPKWVPQLADAAEVLAQLTSERSQAAPIFSALVPNERGMSGVLDVNAKAAGEAGAMARPLVSKVSVFTAASETFSQKNTNASIAQTLERFAPVVAAAKQHGLRVRGYVSCAIECPFEGPIAPAGVVAVARQLLALGVDEIDLGDTIGTGTPETVAALLHAYDEAIGVRASEPRAGSGADGLTLHLHDTFGRAAECVRAALAAGVRAFDGSVAGLGGCPYASTPGRRAPGNIATERLVRTAHSAGFTTGVDLAKLEEAAVFARGIVAASRVCSECAEGLP